MMRTITVIAITGMYLAAWSAAARAQDDAPEEASLQVLVIPLSGTAPALEDAPRVLTDTLLALTRSTGSRPVEARVGKSDIIAITGCSAESRECLDAVADTVGVDQLIFGTIEPAEAGAPDGAGEPGGDAPGTFVVTLTLVEPKKRSYQSRRIVLHATSEADASKEFEPKARAFLAGEPEPAAVPDAPAPPAPGPAAVDTSRRLDLGNVERYSWGVAGGGAAVAVTGVVLLFAAQSKQRQVDDAPTDTVQDLEALDALERSGKRLTGWGNGLLIAGGVVAAVGAVLIVKQGYYDSERPSVALGVAPLVDAGGRGVTVTLGGAF